MPHRQHVVPVLGASASFAGGKGIPETVAEHPAVFATFTAPSFGTVHSRRIVKHTCTGHMPADVTLCVRLS